MSKDGYLYHYTSFDALCNIVSNSTLRATELKYLNDSTEFQYGLSLAEQVAQENGLEVPLGVPEGASWNTLADLYTYVFSLSEEGDLLSQWRAYCPTGGISIGFDVEALAAIARQYGFSLIQCEYDLEVQRQKLKDVLMHAQDVDFYKKFSTLIASLKNPYFSDEREFRLISRPTVFESSVYRAEWYGSRTLPVQYTEIALKALSDEEIKRYHPTLSQEERLVLRSPTYDYSDEKSFQPIRRAIIGPSPYQNLVGISVNDLICQQIAS